MSTASFIVRLASVALSTALLSLAAMAQQTAAQKPKAANGQSFGDWAVHCTAGALPPCEMFQIVQNKDGKQLSRFAFIYLPRRDSSVLTLTVPLGVAFAKGVKLSASLYSSQAMPFLRCDSAGCHVQGAIESAALDKLAASAPQAKLTIADMSGRDIVIPLSLRGFADARKAMERQAQEQVGATGKNDAASTLPQAAAAPSPR